MADFLDDKAGEVSGITTLSEEEIEIRLVDALPIYPALLKLEQEGFIASSWGVSENNRKAKFYKLTRAGHKQLQKEAREWERTTNIIARFFSPREFPS